MVFSSHPRGTGSQWLIHGASHLIPMEPATSPLIYNYWILHMAHTSGEHLAIGKPNSTCIQLPQFCKSTWNTQDANMVAELGILRIFILMQVFNFYQDDRWDWIRWIRLNKMYGNWNLNELFKIRYNFHFFLNAEFGCSGCEMLTNFPSTKSSLKKQKPLLLSVFWSIFNPHLFKDLCFGEESYLLFVVYGMFSWEALPRMKISQVCLRFCLAFLFLQFS